MGCDRGSRGFHYALGPVGQWRLALLSKAVALALAGVVPTAIHAQQPVTTARSLVFDGATVVDVEHGKLLHHQRVVIVGNRIQAMGDMNVISMPESTQVVNARDKYLIPGLWDMHAHVALPSWVLPYFDVSVEDSLYRVHYPLFIASGVTGIREMAQLFDGGADSFRVWQRQVMAGARVGPRAVGPSADFSYQLDVETPEDAHRIIDSLKAAGDAFAKYHDSFGDRAIFFAIAREARRVHLPLVGHIPRMVTNVEAADSGVRSIEHVQEQHQCWAPDPAAPWDSAAAEQRCGPVVHAYLRNGTWVVPTLVAYTFLLDSNQQTHDDDLLKRLTFRRFSDAQRLIRLMHRLGLKNFLAGTDCVPEADRIWGMDHVCSREYALRQELGLLVESGLTPLEALQAATLNPAKFFGATDSLGAVAPGKLADLVLLDGNPLADITNTMRIRAVVANGRYFDRAALDSLLAEVQAKAKQNP